MRLIVPRQIAAALPTLRNTFRPNGGKLGFALFFLWAVGGILALTIPHAKWAANTDKYYSYYGRYIEYENQQRQYERQQNGDDNNNNNNGYNYVPDCQWYQWKCRKQMYYYFQNNGNNDNNAVILPTWYKFLGGQSAGGEEMRRWQEENGMMSADDTPGPVAFVNGYTIFLFVALLLYGSFVFITGRAFGGLIMTMAFFGQFLLMIILLLPQGIIATEGRELENSVYGWYGQTAVLMVYENFAYMIFCLSFIGVLALLKLVLWYKGKNEIADDHASMKLDGRSDESYHSSGMYYKAEDMPAKGAHHEMV